MPGDWDIGNIWRGVQRDVQGTVNAVENEVTAALGQLGALYGDGLAGLAGMEWFVQYLHERGEDPVSIIGRLVAHCYERGANPVWVLEELIGGIQREGLEHYARRMVERAIEPIRGAMRQQTTQGMALAMLHQETIDTVQAKLGALFAGQTRSGRPLKGEIVNVLTSRFAATATGLTTMSSALNPHTGTGGVTQQQINDDFWHALFIAVAGVVVVDLLILVVEAIVAVGTAGVALPVEGALDAGVIAVEAGLLAAFAVVDFVVWIIRTHQLQTATDAPPVSPPASKPVPPPTLKPWNNPRFWLAVAAALGAILLKMISALTPDERQQLIDQLKKAGCDQASIEAFLNAHPNLSVQDALSALQAQQLIAQFQAYQTELDAALADPKYASPALQQSIRSMQRMLNAQIQALQAAEDSILNGTAHAAQVNQINASAQGVLQGSWAEWKLAQYYADQGKLLFFGKSYKDPATGQFLTDADLVIRDGNGVRIIQLKAYDTSFGINYKGDPNKFSDKWTDLANQVNNTEKVASDSNFIQDVKNADPNFDGTVKIEVDLVNTEPLDPNTPGWKNVANKLQSDFGVDVQTPQNPGSPFSEGGGGGSLYSGIINPPTPPSNWCAPVPTPTPTPPPTPTP